MLTHAGEWSKKAGISVLSLSLFCGVAGYAEARLNYSLGYASNHNSNHQLRSGGGDQSSTVHTFDGRIVGQSQGGRITSTMDLNFGYSTGSHVETRAVGSGGAHVDFAIRPQRLHWRFSDTLSRTLIDPTESSIDPDNSDLRNTFSTGPELTMDLFGRNRLVLQGTFSRTSHIEESNNDTESRSGAMEIERSVSERTAAAIRYNYVESELIETTGLSSEISRVENSALTFRMSGPKWGLATQLGYGRDIGTKFDTETGGIDFSYQLNARTRYTLSSSKRLTTAGVADTDDLTAQINALALSALLCQNGQSSAVDCGFVRRLEGAGKLDNGLILNDDDLARALFTNNSGTTVVYSTQFGVTWQPNVVSYSLLYFDNEQRDVLDESISEFIEPNRVESKGVALSAQYRFNERFNAAARITRNTRTAFNFSALPQETVEEENRETGSTIQLGYRLSSTIESGLDLSYLKSDRTDDTGDQGGDSYQVGVSLVWRI